MDRRSIMIVEDEYINRKVLTKMLQDEFDVVEATDGLEAMDIINEQQVSISLILLDIYMPNMGGFEFLKICNDKKLIGKIPVILVTCDSADDTINRGFELGISDFVTKPFNYEILHRRVRNTIELFGEQERLNELVDDQTRQIHKINNELVNMNEILVRQAKQFKIASMQSYDLIVEYDLGKNSFELLYYNNRISDCKAFDGRDYLIKTVYTEDYPVVSDIMRISINEIAEKDANIRLVRHDSGEFAWYHVIVSPICDANTVVQKLLFTFSDIDERYRKELALMQRAEIDMLTGILNRSAGEERINTILTNNSYGGTAVLIMLDIDNFKQVNDLSGHAVGDKALVLMARILTEVCDDSVVGRFGGDEFFVFLDKVDFKRDVTEKIDEIIARVCEVDDTMIPSVSIGADYVRKGDSFILLMKRADMALYMMKGDGKGGYRFYDDISYRFKNSKYSIRANEVSVNEDITVRISGKLFFFKYTYDLRTQLNSILGIASRLETSLSNPNSRNINIMCNYVKAITNHGQCLADSVEGLTESCVLRDGEIVIDEDKFSDYIRIKNENKGKKISLAMPDLSGKRILVVDDNTAGVSFVSDILGDCGAFVNCVYNAEDAISEFMSTLTGYYDIILTDIVMPGLDGYEMAGRIRRMDREDADAIPIIAISASVFNNDKEKACEYGMNDFISKPIRQEDLFRTLEKYLF